jgi:acylphosphatase
MAPHAEKAIRVTVEGRVQGVGFRYTTRGVAQELGLAGWVRNLPNGAVEVWAQGSVDVVDQLQALLEHGPQGSLVKSVEFEVVDPDLTLEGFEIRF